MWAINPPNHNVLYLQFDFNISLSVYSWENVSHNCNYSWHKALPHHELSNYSRVLNNNLTSIDIPDDLLLCTNCNCTNDFHKHAIDSLCYSIICSCMAASAEYVPTVRPRAREVSGWNDQVKPERDRSLFWYCIWLESGKPNTGLKIMKRTRHLYHYAVCCCKKNQLNIQKQKLAENMSISTNFWKELKKISPANKVTTNVMDNAHGDKNEMELLLTNYKTLYNRVPTTDDEIQHLNCIIDNGISDFKERGMLSTPDRIHKSILQLKRAKMMGMLSLNPIN